MSRPKAPQTAASARTGRKSGGRAGRRAARQAGASGMAVRPSMEGGRYKPLSDRDVERIHTAALDILEEGIAKHPDEAEEMGGEFLNLWTARLRPNAGSSQNAAISAAIFARQSSRPRSQSKLAFCSASRSGTARGSRIFANE